MRPQRRTSRPSCSCATANKQRPGRCAKRVSFAATNPDVFVNLGQLAWEVGDKGTAIELATRALESNPTNGPALVNTILYAADGDPHRVQERLAEAESRLPNDPHVLTFVADKQDLDAVPGTPGFAPFSVSPYEFPVR
jgi:hypothetical protein